MSNYTLSDERRQELKENEEEAKEADTHITEEYAAVLADKFGVTDERATKLAYGIELANRNKDGLSSDNVEAELETVYGVSKEALDLTRRNYKETGRMEQVLEADNEDLAEGVPTLSTDFEGLEELVDQLEGHPSEYTLVHDPENQFAQLVRDLNQADKELGPEDVAVTRKEDAQAARETREAHIEALVSDKDIDREEVENLSLPALERLSGDSGGSKGQGSPAPRSGDIQKDDTVPRGKQDKLADLREQEEFYERKSGPLAEKGLEAVRQEIEELKGR